MTLTWTRVNNYYKRNIARALFRKLVDVRPQVPLVSFTFDDFPRSALLAGGAILSRFDVRGTYYASFGLLGTDAPTGPIFISSDLPILMNGGHELGCHSFSHLHSWDTDVRSYEHSLVENRAALNRLVPGVEFKTFSYPISAPRPLIKLRAAKHFLCCRAGGQTFNVGTTDLNQLAAYFLEKGRNDVKSVTDMIDRNRAHRGWLIFATHDISASPTPYGCTPEFFEHIVRYARNSGARILPVIEALEVLGAANGGSIRVG